MPANQLADAAAAAQAAADLCFNGNSFYILAAMGSTLIGAISTLFGFLMLSYRSRITSAESREADAYKDRDSAVKDRNEALWRLQETREQYRSFVEEQRGPPRLPDSWTGPERRGSR